MPLIPGFPSTLNGIAVAVGGVAAILATWYVGKVLVKWLQSYQDGKNKTQTTDEREQAQEDDRKANSESDALKQIDGR